MLNIEELKKEIERILQQVQLQYGGLSKEEKKELLFLGDRFNHFITCQAIFEDYNEKDN